MAELSGFFTAEEQADGSYDRVYTAEQFAYYFSKFIGNGIYINPSTQCQVSQASTVGMSVDVAIGDAYINGCWYQNTSVKNLQINIASGSLDRIDLVVLRWSKATRDIKAEIVTGTAAATAQAPALQRDENIYELCLAKILVNRASTQITNSMIVDTRSNNDLCGFVHGVVDQIDTTNLFQQFTATFNEFFDEGSQEFSDWVLQKQEEYNNFVESKNNDFTAWFDDIKSQLTEDVAGSLQLQINNVKSDLADVDNDLTAHETTFVNYQNKNELSLIEVKNLSIPVASWAAVSSPISGFRYIESNANVINAYNTLTNNGAYTGAILANANFNVASMPVANTAEVYGAFEVDSTGKLNFYAKKKPTAALTYNLFLQRKIVK